METPTQHGYACHVALSLAQGTLRPGQVAFLFGVPKTRPFSLVRGRAVACLCRWMQVDQASISRVMVRSTR